MNQKPPPPPSQIIKEDFSMSGKLAIIVSSFLLGYSIVYFIFKLFIL